MTGLHLAQYRIDAELGRGGMGIVYRATDTKLNRSVAVKILPSAALSSDDDRARFFREAQAAAQLHHPNIATVFGIDEAVPHAEGAEPAPGGERRPFIAMEYIEGETLHDRVRTGPLKLTEAVSIAVQVAEALKAAHAKSIVHRDIKSANVMLTPDGVAKVLDFGLAKTNQSTMLTRMGATLGTVAYMSPEQARGQEVDGRSDLYSLGTVLYEMVAGRLPFAGDYEQAIVYGILNESPEPLTSLRTGVPMELERIVGKLLTKEADYRYQGAADLIADLKSLDVSGSGLSRRAFQAAAGTTQQGGMQAGTAVAAAPKAVLPRWVWPTVAAAALVIGAVGAWLAKPGSPPPAGLVTRSTLALSPARSTTGQVSLSRDGSILATMSNEEEGMQVVIRGLAQDGARVLSGIASNSFPSISPDGRWVAYHSRGSLYRKPVDGGSAQVLAQMSGFTTAWLSNDEIISDGEGGLVRVSVGGDVIPIPRDTTMVGTPLVPEPVPGTDIVLATLVQGGGGDAQRIVAIDISNGDMTVIGPSGAYGPRYHRSGYVMFYLNGDVHAAPFDAGTLKLDGNFVVQTMVGSAGPSGLIPSFAISDDLLIYHPGTDFVREGREFAIADATGAHAVIKVDASTLWDPRFSPDGKQLLSHGALEDGEADIWLTDINRGTTRRMTPNPGEQETAFWGSSGRHFYYSSDDDQSEYVLRQTVDNSAPVDTLFATPHHLHLESVSKDGRWIVVMLRADSSDDLWLIDTEDATAARPLLDSAVDESAARISPDGRLIAYQTDVTGRVEVYVARFPDMQAPTLVSSGGGTGAVWSASGRTLFYLGADALMRVELANGVAGPPEVVFELPSDFARGGQHTMYDVFGEGSRFAFVLSPKQDADASVAQLVTGLGTLLRSLDPSRAGDQ